MASITESPVSETVLPARDSGAAAADDPAWDRIGRVAGWAFAITFLLASVALLIDAVGLLGSAPGFTVTGGGEVQDQAGFFRGLFAHQRQILPDIVLRTALFFAAYVSLVPFGLALRRVLGRASAEAELAARLLVIGGVVSAVSQLVTLVQVETWRNDWSVTEPQVLLSYATGVGPMDALSMWLSLAGLLLIGGGLFYAGRRLIRDAATPRWLGFGAYTLSAAALLLVVIDVAGDIGLGGMDIAHNVVALPLSIVAVPAVVGGLALRFPRAR